mmetsp:Transcript_2914/g.6294  ORF Transcript_2914/g.6294 Transcript_2914/m.6294 type:complete len:129 (-) Transcript_2914:2128-2514(-)
MMGDHARPLFDTLTVYDLFQFNIIFPGRMMISSNIILSLSRIPGMRPVIGVSILYPASGGEVPIQRFFTFVFNCYRGYLLFSSMSWGYPRPKYFPTGVRQWYKWYPISLHASRSSIINSTWIYAAGIL